jgi:hypothetical protein
MGLDLFGGMFGGGGGGGGDMLGGLLGGFQGSGGLLGSGSMLAPIGSMLGKPDPEKIASEERQAMQALAQQLIGMAQQEQARRLTLQDPLRAQLFGGTVGPPTGPAGSAGTALGAAAQRGGGGGGFGMGDLMSHLQPGTGLGFFPGGGPLGAFLGKPSGAAPPAPAVSGTGKPTITGTPGGGQIPTFLATGVLPPALQAPFQLQSEAIASQGQQARQDLLGRVPARGGEMNQLLAQQRLSEAQQQAQIPLASLPLRQQLFNDTLRAALGQEFPVSQTLAGANAPLRGSGQLHLGAWDLNMKFKENIASMAGFAGGIMGG